MSSNRNLVLTAMVFAVGMTFIDQTIVAIAIPNIQEELSLSATGAQWVIDGYLLALAALFALCGKLGDVLGRRRMVVIGVIGFAVASAACGFTPKGAVAQAWIIGFRVLQGAAAALLFPAAVGIVVATFPLRERGNAMAIFFGIAGGLTAIGPIAGGYLTRWTWRSIFWINIPVARSRSVAGCREPARCVRDGRRRGREAGGERRRGRAARGSGAGRSGRHVAGGLRAAGGEVMTATTSQRRFASVPIDTGATGKRVESNSMGSIGCPLSITGERRRIAR